MVLGNGGWAPLTTFPAGQQHATMTASPIVTEHSDLRYRHDKTMVPDLRFSLWVGVGV